MPFLANETLDSRLYAPVSGTPHSKFHLHPKFPVKHIQHKGKGNIHRQTGKIYTSTGTWGKEATKQPLEEVKLYKQGARDRPERGKE